MTAPLSTSIALWDRMRARLPWHWLTAGWWRYLFGPRDVPASAGRLATAICRAKGHPAGVWWFNHGGNEPDMRCKCCGDDLA